MTQAEERVRRLRKRIKELEKGMPKESEVQMKARIRPGAIVGQDHGIGPVNMLGALGEDMATKVFDVHPFSEGRVRLTARGYGEEGAYGKAYGNGALYVAKEDVIPVDEPLKVDPYEDKEGVKIAEAPDGLTEEIYKAYRYFTSRFLRLGTMTRGEIAKPGERTEMFQAWLALKLALAKSPAMQAGSDPPRPDVFWAGPPGARGDAQGPG